MLSEMFPRAHARFASLPLLGPHIEEFMGWLSSRGYPPHPIRCRIRETPRLDARLRRRGIRRLADLSAPQLMSFAPRDSQDNNLIAFLQHLEDHRRNGVPTRNARLAAVHAFARYAAADHPEHLELCQRILAVPFKRARTRVVEYLESDEMRAILDAPDRTTLDGRRDHAMFLTLFNTGARVREILDVRPCDLQLVRPLQIRLRGKGRKERMCPLWPQTADVLHALLH